MVTYWLPTTPETGTTSRNSIRIRARVPETRLGQLSCPVTDDTPGTFRAVNRGDNAWILGSIGSTSRRRHLAGYEKRRKRRNAVPRELPPPPAALATSRRTLSLINESISLLERPETSEILKEILQLFLGI